MKIGDVIHCGSEEEAVGVAYDLHPAHTCVKRPADPKMDLVITEMPLPKSIAKRAEVLSEIICDNFCRYRDTCDDNCECEWTRNFGECPLNML